MFPLKVGLIGLQTEVHWQESAFISHIINALADLILVLHPRNSKHPFIQDAHQGLAQLRIAACVTSLPYQ
jgi:hypothetical protein